MIQKNCTLLSACPCSRRSLRSPNLILGRKYSLYHKALPDTLKGLLNQDESCLTSNFTSSMVRKMETTLTLILFVIGGLCVALAYVTVGTKIRHFSHMGTPQDNPT